MMWEVLWFALFNVLTIKGLSMTNLVKTSSWIPNWKVDCANDTILTSPVPNAASCAVLLDGCSSCCTAGYDAKRRECHLLTASPKSIIRQSPIPQPCSRECAAHKSLQFTHACPLERAPDNGTVTYTYSHNLPYPQEAVYSCQRCLNMLGWNVSTCDANGWSSPRPNCTDRNITSMEIGTGNSKQAAIINGWIVIQNRMNLDVDFNQSYNAYISGFGDMSGDFWWGLEALHVLTSARTYKLRVEMEAYDTGVTFFQEYLSFVVKSASSKYQLSVGNSFGTAGDGLKGLDGMKFSTYNRDHDSAAHVHCGQVYGGGWWFQNCFKLNLGSSYPNGPSKQCVNRNRHCIHWSPLRHYTPNGIKKIRMVIK